MANHDRYETDILKALQSIADILKALQSIATRLKTIETASVVFAEKYLYGTKNEHKCSKDIEIKEE